MTIQLPSHVAQALTWNRRDVCNICFVQAYEEELQMLRTQLEESEANNDELNLMLQELQERQFLEG